MAKRRLFLTVEERKLLRDVRKLVTKTHWIKGMYQRPDREIADKTCYCLVGLVNHVCNAPIGSSAGVSLDFPSPAPSVCPSVWAYDTYNLKAQKHVFEAIANAIRKQTPRTKMHSIERWNDRPQTSRDDILAVIDTALTLEVSP